MKNPFHSILKIISLPVLLVILASTVLPGRADQRSAFLQERFKASVNHMVQQVRGAPDPSAQREIIGKFLLRMDDRLGMAESLVPVAEQPAVDALRAKVESQYADLNGLNGKEKVADAQLVSFARYIQQDAEQADAYWTGNGIYISAGVLIIILLLILILR